MTSNSYDHFLSLEATAQDLIDELTKLADVVDGYREVKQGLVDDYGKAKQGLVDYREAKQSLVDGYGKVIQSLVDASQGLLAATTQYRDIASQVGQVAASMSRVGMPELLDAVRQVKENQDELLESANEARIQMERREQAVADGLTRLSDDVQQRLQETTSGFRDIGRFLEENQRTVTDSLERLLSPVQDNQDALLGSVHEARNQIARIEQAVGGSLAELRAGVGEATSRVASIQTLTEEVGENARREAARTRLLIVIGAGLATAAGAAATVTPLLNLG